MVANVLLDNVTHKDLKIETARSEALGDAIRFSFVVPREFRQVATCYPIVFRKDAETGQFEAVAIFGFEPNENVFLNEKGWDADYIPLSVQRLPFAIGSSYDSQKGETQSVIHVDMDHPKATAGTGENVFLEHGGNSPFLENINTILAELIAGVGESQHFFKALTEYELIEPFTLKIPAADGAVELTGFYTINEEKLLGLTGESLAQVHSSGIAGLCYYVLASMSNISKLIKLKFNR